MLRFETGLAHGSIASRSVVTSASQTAAEQCCRRGTQNMTQPHWGGAAAMPARRCGRAGAGAGEPAVRGLRGGAQQLGQRELRRVRVPGLRWRPPGPGHPRLQGVPPPPLPRATRSARALAAAYWVRMRPVRQHGVGIFFLQADQLLNALSACRALPPGQPAVTLVPAPMQLKSLHDVRARTICHD